MRLRYLFKIFFMYILTLWQGCYGGHGQVGSGAKKCAPVKLDLVFIVDSSGSVMSYNFQKTKDFIQNVIDQLPVYGDAIRIGIVRYSTNADIITFLNEDMDQNKKSEVLQSMEYRPGSTRTNVALQLANRIVLTSRRGDRPDVPNLIILITDGVSASTTFTSREANLLKERPGVKILVIGIGNTLNDDELLAVASSPEMVHKVTSFSKLEGIVDSLATVTCSDTLSGADGKTSTLLPPTTQKKENQSSEAASTTSLLSLSPTRVTLLSSANFSSPTQPMITSQSQFWSNTAEAHLSNPVSTMISRSSSSKKVTFSSSSSSLSSTLSSPGSSLLSSEPSLYIGPSASYESSSTTLVMSPTTMSDPEIEMISDLAFTGSQTNVADILQPSASSLILASSRLFEDMPHDQVSSHTADFQGDISVTTMSYIPSPSLSYTTATSVSSSFLLSSTMTDDYVSSISDGENAQTFSTSTFLFEKTLDPDTSRISATSTTPLLSISPSATLEPTADALNKDSVTSTLPAHILPSESFFTDQVLLSSSLNPNIPGHQETMVAYSVLSHKSAIVSHTPVVVSQTMVQGDKENVTAVSYHKQDEADMASSDLYLFVAAGAAGAVALTAATICITLMCRKRSQSDESDA